MSHSASPSLSRPTPSRPAITASTLVGALLGKKRGADEPKLPTHWQVSLKVAGETFRIAGKLGRLSCEAGPGSRSLTWGILEPCDCPCRFLRSTVPLKEARASWPFLLEPQLPMPVDTLRITGAIVRSDAEDWEALVCYARADRAVLEAGVDALLPGSLAGLGLMLWLRERDAPRSEPFDGLWGIDFPLSSLLVLIVDGRPVGVRAVPRRDQLRLQMAALELHPQADRFWLGDSAPEGWVPFKGPAGISADHIWLALCAMTIAQTAESADLIPMSFVRRLDLPRARRTLWGISSLFLLLTLALLLGGRWLLEQRLEDSAVSRDSLAIEMARLKKEAADASAPFRPEPPLPRCSSVLRWLASIPGLHRDEGLSIERIRYQITQYPTASKEREPYNGKVSVELSCKDAFRARQILDFISAPDPHSPVDTRLALEWTHHQGLYRLNFTLKPMKCP
jgi:hypothetical protein